jgi:hypothetical protein
MIEIWLIFFISLFSLAVQSCLREFHFLRRNLAAYMHRLPKKTLKVVYHTWTVYHAVTSDMFFQDLKLKVEHGP